MTYFDISRFINSLTNRFSHFIEVLILTSLKFGKYIVASDSISYPCSNRIDTHSIYELPNFTFILFNPVSTNPPNVELGNKLVRIILYTYY